MKRESDHVPGMESAGCSSPGVPVPECVFQTLSVARNWHRGPVHLQVRGAHVSMAGGVGLGTKNVVSEDWLGREAGELGQPALCWPVSCAGTSLGLLWCLGTFLWD